MFRSKRSRAALVGFLMVVATLLANEVVNYLNLRRIDRNRDLVQERHRAIIELKTLLSALVETESGMRGYVITGEELFLEPYRESAREVDRSLRQVEQLSAQTPRQQELLRRLRPLVQERLELIEQNITARHRDFAGARHRIGEGHGRAVMKNIHVHLAHMENEERRVLGLRAAESRRGYLTSLITGFVMTLMGLGLATAGYYLIARDFRRREQAAAELQRANQFLEDRVLERTAEISKANLVLRAEIDERRRAEDQVRLFAEELQRSNRELEQFASVASHDLQEPLRKIQAFGDRLHARCRDELGEQGQDYLDRMLASAGRMRTLIDDLLTYSRAATKVQPYSLVDLNDIVQEVASDLEGRVEQAGGSIDVGELPTVRANPIQMRQLFQNLIGNALKFHRPDEPPRVRVYSQEETDETGVLRCQITVEDNGIGFEQGYVDRIFELFQRLHGRDDYDGTGMGLAICRKIVERHNGQITAVSSPGKGSRFLVTLPAEEPAKESIDESPHEAHYHSDGG